MSWLETSIMAKRGVARGKAGRATRSPTSSRASIHYVYGPYAEPVLDGRARRRRLGETHDAFEGKIKSETDMPSEMLNFPFLNPQNGPIYVKGAEKGDCLAVYIQSIKPRGPQPVGTTCLIPEFGGLVGTGHTALLNAPLPERVKKIKVDEKRRLLERQASRCPTSRSSAPSAPRRRSRRLPRCSRTITAATWTCPTSAPAR